MNVEIVFILSVLAITLCIMTLISLVLLAKDVNTIMHKLNTMTTSAPSRPTSPLSQKSRCLTCEHKLCPRQFNETLSCDDCKMYDSAYQCKCVRYDFDRDGKCTEYKEVKK